MEMVAIVSDVMLTIFGLVYYISGIIVHILQIRSTNR